MSISDDHDLFYEKLCEDHVKFINELTNAPNNGDEYTIDENGDAIFNVGAFVLESNLCTPNKVKLTQIVSELGSRRHLTPFRFPREAYGYLVCFSWGIEQGLKVKECK